jgi:hypothetical protein
LCEIAKTPAEFIAAIDRALKHPDHDRVKRALELARKNSWEGTVKTMQNLIGEAIGKDERRSNREIKPMTEAELEYQYAPTQGS